MVVVVAEMSKGTYSESGRLPPEDQFVFWCLYVSFVVSELQPHTLFL